MAAAPDSQIKQRILQRLQAFHEPSFRSPGNGWYKVNLHIEAGGNDPAAIVASARAADVDMIAITDHQTFEHVRAVQVAAESPGRPLEVLPGIEITAQEGVHLLAIFSMAFDRTEQEHFIGWLELKKVGDTRHASKRTVSDILSRVHTLGGLVSIPHPFSSKTGLLDSARKVGTKEDWLATGHVRLLELSQEHQSDKIRFIGHDDSGNWINRYVLASARSEDIRKSNYCLAPYNTGDAHTPAEIPSTCSWFRMSEGSIAGLKQVACEPRTRIAVLPPPQEVHDAVLSLDVQGGYFDGETIDFNPSLNCLIGQNYSGKSAVFDFIRFALAQDTGDKDSRARLLVRLFGILQPDSSVVLYVRHHREVFAIYREFSPEITGEGSELKILGCPTTPYTYRLTTAGASLDPVEQFSFGVELYEQGRISRLREDASRQLRMIDELAEIAPLLERRSAIVSNLTASVQLLKPLYERQESLKQQVQQEGDIRNELSEKRKLLPGKEEEAWDRAKLIAETLQDDLLELRRIAGLIIDDTEALDPDDSDLLLLFRRELPDLDFEDVAELDLLKGWYERAQETYKRIAAGRQVIVEAISELEESTAEAIREWTEHAEEHERQLRHKLAQSGVESPKELIARVDELRKALNNLIKSQKPEYSRVNARVSELEHQRESLLEALDTVAKEISTARKHKAAEITSELEGYIKVSIEPLGYDKRYAHLLHELCDAVSSRSRKIMNRDDQITAIASVLSPLQLAAALRAKGLVSTTDGKQMRLNEIVGITENTEAILLSIAGNVELMNRLETLVIDDLPRILVRRSGEDTYGDLKTGLSPGEQSAALLTLALRARSNPLLIDQPEDELGYSYVVHLVVPKLLDTKLQRQLIIITHNANIPVLGDADFITKLKNVPAQASAGRSRRCTIDLIGGFEDKAITEALLELEGGPEAFRYRQYRYSLPQSF